MLFVKSVEKNWLASLGRLTPSTFIDRSHVWQAPHIGHETCEQRGHRDWKSVQFRVGFWQVEYEACIQTAGPDGFHLLQTRQWLKLKLAGGTQLHAARETLEKFEALDRNFDC
jgi:hypothetical protein